MNGPAGTCSLHAELQILLRNPALLLREWNWKAAAFSAIIRGGIFFATNRSTSHSLAWRAMGVETIYAIAAAGMAGAVTQRLRNSRPLWQTAFVLLLVMPLLMLRAQTAIHHIAGTPHVRAGLLLSFLFASLATGFNWLAMRHGVFLSGSGRTFWQDVGSLHRLLLR